MKNTINLLLFFIPTCYLSAQKFDFKVGEINDSSNLISYFPLFQRGAYYNLNNDEYVNANKLKEFSDTLNLYVRLNLCSNYKYHKKILDLGNINTILILKLQDTMRKGEKYKLKCRLKLNDKNVKLNAVNFILDSTNILPSNLNKLFGVEFLSPQRISLPIDTSDYYIKNRKTILDFTNNFQVNNDIECCKWYDLETEFISLGGEYLLYFNIAGHPTTLIFNKNPIGNDDISLDIDYIEITKMND